MRIKSFFYISVLLFVLAGCKSKKETPAEQFENLNKYQEYITEVTHGIISAQSDVRVVLNTPIESWNNGDELDASLLSVSPRTKGKVVSLDNRTIAFIPEDGFKQDTEASDVLSLENAKELVSVTHNGKKINVKFDETVTKGTQFQFKIDSIHRYEEDSELEIEWNGNKLDIESEGKNVINIAGKNNFTVLDLSVETGDNQVVLVNFSDPLKKGQNFKGLVVLEGVENPKYKVDGNTLKVYPSSDLKGTANLEVLQGIESEDGYKLKNKFEQRVAFEQLKPEVRLLSNGTILPSSNNLKINFEAVNLKAVDVSVFKIYENNVLQFLQNNNLNGQGNLRSVGRPIARKKIVLQNNLSNDNGKWAAHAIDLIPTNVTEQILIPVDESEENFDEEEENSSWDGVEDYYDEYGYYDYNWNERENPCDKSYFYNKKISMNVLATDIGVTIKRGVNKSYFVAVNDILNTNPIPGAKVTFYNFQQQAVGNVITDTDGTAIFDSEKAAFFAVAENKGQKNYVKLNDGNALSVSKFNVSGTRLQKGIKGFIFGERGVWRPGDQIYLSFMLNDNANKLPANHPVKLELMDPYNKVVHREVTKNGLNNFFHFNIKTDENAPTGNWLAKVSVGGASFTKSLKIETIKPNRLKIKTEFDAEVLSGSKPIKGNMEVKWLHGAIAKNLKADITAKFNRANTKFDKFPGYVFDDPTRSFSVEDQVVFNNKIDAEGKASFNLNPQLNSKAPGIYVVRVEDPNGGHATGKAIYIDWPGWAGKSRKGDPSAATMLSFSTDKETYNVGEKATVSFPSSFGGRALITVENGSEVLESLWVETGISVEDKETKLEPVIKMPDVLRPEETITVKTLTRFKTPNPWNTFYAKEALGVKTWDVYDDVIGAFGGKIDQVFAIGGDGELAGAKNKKANRFEPMVVSFSLKDGEKKSHEIRIPKYVGSVRTMVIAGDNSKEAYGETEKTTAVRKPLMILGFFAKKDYSW
ncbi:putative lipoprotein YfhM [Nymphon striatum]|nr:putative lipoprotein YfhM [Nymphon striatum]